MTSGSLGYHWHGVPRGLGRRDVLSLGMHSLFFGPFVLEPNLNTSDFQSGLLGHLFSHEPGGSRCLGKNSHHDIHLVLGKLGSGYPFLVLR